MKKTKIIAGILLLAGVMWGQHFVKTWSGNPGPGAMSVFVTVATLNGVDLVEGDEIAVFDGDNCVGVAVLPAGGIEVPFTSIVLAADGSVDNGFVEGNPIMFKYWDSAHGIEVQNDGITAGWFNCANGEPASTDLFVKDEAFCTTLTGTVVLPPTAGFTYVANNLEVQFTDTSTPGDGTITGWAWDFAGGSSAEQSPFYTFPDAGTYTVILTVTDDNGLTDDYSEVLEITINLQPTAVAGADVEVMDCEGDGEIITLDGSGSSDADGSIADWNWTWDGGSANGEIVDFTFAAGTYAVTLTVTDDGGATATDEMIVIVNSNSAPVADAGADQDVTYLEDATDYTVTLSGSATDAEDNIASYTWTPGDLDGASVDVVLSEGVHTYILTVVDACGAFSSDAITITVNHNTGPSLVIPTVPTVWVASDAVSGEVTIDASACSDADGDALTFDFWWDGGSAYDAGPTPTVTLPAAGVAGTTLDVTVWFALTDEHGDGSNTAFDVPMYNNMAPVANAGVDQEITAGGDVTLDGSLSSDGDDGIVSYSWAENGVEFATVATYVWTSVPAGGHNVSLTVTDAFGETSTDWVSITAAADQLFFFPYGYQEDGSCPADANGAYPVFVTATTFCGMELSGADEIGVYMQYGGQWYLVGAGFYSLEYVAGIGADAVILTACKDPFTPPLVDFAGIGYIDDYDILFKIGIAGFDYNDDTIVDENDAFFVTPTFDTGAAGAGDGTFGNNNWAVASLKKNCAPEFVDLPTDPVVDEGADIDFVIAATDADNDDVIITYDALPDDATFVGGAFHWTTDFTDAGVYTVTYTATEDYVEALFVEHTVTITVNQVNITPEFCDNPAPADVNETEIMTFALCATDFDGDQVQIDISEFGGDFTVEQQGRVVFNADVLNSSASFTWETNYADAGAYEVTFRGRDYAADPVYEIFQTVTFSILDINRDPEFADLAAAFTVNDAEDIQFSVVATDSDLPADVLTITYTDLPEGATFTTDGGFGTFAWTPGYEQTGVYPITFTVTDQAAATDVVSTTITVLNVNQDPVADPIADITVNETELVEFVVTASDPDSYDAGNLVWSWNSDDLPAGATFDPATATFSWLTTLDDAGLYNPAFTVTDTYGATDGFTVWITVEQNNQTPEFTVYPDAQVVADEMDVIELHFEATDYEDGMLMFFIATPGGLEEGSYELSVDVINNAADLTIVTDYDYSGTYAPQIVVSDGELAASVTLDIVVNHVNRDPYFTEVPDAEYTINESDLLAFSLVFADDDIEDQSNLLVTADGVPAGASFDGVNFTWATGLDDEGDYDVTFALSDGAGGSAGTATVIHVLKTNQAPVISVSAEEDIVDETATVTVNISATDYDGDALSFSIIPYEAPLESDYYEALTLGGNFVDNGDGTATFTWVTTYDDEGMYDGMFVVTDGELSDDAVYSLTINNLNRAPYWLIAPGAMYSGDEGTEIAFSVAAFDDDGDDLAIAAIGDLLDYFTDNGDGTADFAFAPTFDDAGIYSMIITLTDSFGEGPSSDFVTITVVEAGGYYSFNFTSPWSWVSYHVSPLNTSVVDMFDGTGLIILQDGEGNVYQPPAAPDPEIANWEITKGYAVAVSASMDLEIVGTPIDQAATPIDLTAGWNFISYLPAEPNDVAIALDGVVDNLAIAKSRGGFYIPGTTATLGDMVPGEGYKLGMWDAATLTYPGGGFAKGGSVATEYVEATHFEFVSGTMDYYPIVMNALDLSGVTVDVGDELGVFANGRCVGGSVITDTEAMTLVAWADDSMTDFVEGYKANDQIELRFWDSAVNAETVLDANFIEGEGTFSGFYTIATATGELIPAEFDLSQNYPNPFNPTTSISYQIPSDANVMLTIYNVLGQEIRTLVNTTQEAGYYSTNWDGLDNAGMRMSSGVYFYQLVTPESKMTKKMVLMK